MAQLETWIKQDLKEPLHVRYLSGNMFTQDNAANLVGVEVFDDGEPATLGGSVSANVVRSDGGTVAVSGGTLSGNKVSVILPQAAYAIPGAISIIIKLTTGGTVTTLGAIVVTVYRSSTDAAIDPGTIIPSVQNLISQIEATVATIPADYSNLWTSLAPAFSTSTEYTAGQYFTYNGHLYRFTENHPAGSFVNTDCTQVDVGGELSSLKSAINTLDDTVKDFGVEETQIGNYYVLNPEDKYISVKANSSVIVGNRNMVPVLTNDVVGQEYTAWGITRVKNADGSYTYSGTAERNITYPYAQDYPHLPVGTYTLSGCPAGLSLVMSADYFVGGTRKNLTRDRGASGTGTMLEGGTNVHVYFEIPSGTVLSTPITVKPQLERGEVATEYIKCANHEVAANTDIPVTEITYIFEREPFTLTTSRIDLADIRERLSNAEDDIDDIREDIETINGNIENIENGLEEAIENSLKPYPAIPLETEAIATFTDGANSIPCERVIVNAEYNATPIDKCRVFVSGKNMFNYSDIITKQHVTKNADGTITTPATSSIYSGLYGAETAIPLEDVGRLLFLPAGSYYVRYSGVSTMALRSVDGATGTKNGTVYIRSGKIDLATDTLIDISFNGTLTALTISTEEQITDLPFEETSITVPFVDDEGNPFSIYGGKVDLTKGIVTELYDASGNELENPINHSMEPINVYSYLGFNHIWSNCESVSVVYRADIKQYVDQRNMSELLEKYNIDASVYGNVRMDMLMQPGTNVIAIAHRGLSHSYPENTMPAFKAAAIAGFLCVETDIQWTSDNIPVLCHDATINHTARNADGTELTQTIYIRDITYEQILQYDFGIWKGEQFAGTKIPTFDEFILFCKQAGLHPQIELKYNQQTMEQTALVIQKIIDCGMMNRVCWTSNFKDLLLQVLSVHQGANVCLIASSLIESRWNDLLEIKAKYPAVNIMVACGIDYIYQEMEETIARLKSVKVPMGIWTIDNAATIKNLDPYITTITSNMLNAGVVLREGALS